MLRKEDYEEIFGISAPWHIENSELTTAPVYQALPYEMHIYLALEAGEYETVSLETFDKGIVAGVRTYIHAEIPYIKDKGRLNAPWATSDGALL